MRTFNQTTPNLFIAALFLFVILISAVVGNIDRDNNQAAVPGLIEKEIIFPEAMVTKVTDGDTIHVLTSIMSSSSPQSGEKTAYTVRLIGMNTPETVDPRKEVECFGREATARAKEILDGKIIKLELDPTQQKFDKYGRLLAYVYIEDVLFNEYMIENGYAYEYTYDSPYAYQAEFKNVQSEAQTAKRGLWGDMGTGSGCQASDLNIE